MSSAPTTTRTRTRTRAPGRVVAGAAALDVAAVVVFVLVGRRSHAEGLTVAGVADTAWPFLVGLGVGWVVTRAWRAPLPVRTGVALWVSTVALGLVARTVDRGEVPPSFAVVTTVVLGALLVGWRAVARALRRRA